LKGPGFRVCVRAMFRLPLWIEWLKISPAGAEVVLAQGVSPWVEWEIDLSPFRDDTVLTHTLQPCRKGPLPEQGFSP
jgi:hypothetical protein